jgi:hypothetical protein
MGGKTTSEVKTMIKNELSTEINNKTKNISTLVNNSVTNIMQSIKQTAEAEVTATTNILNTSNISGLVLRGPGSKITLNQDAVAKIENTAIIKIISDAAELQKMGNNIADNIKSNLQNNQGAKQDLESLSKIGEFSKKNGGPEGMLDTLAQTVGGMVASLTNIGGSTSSLNDTQIINSIKTTINNETINENNISNSINTSISSMMEQMAKAKCNFNTDGKNELNISNAEVTDGAVYTQSQSLNLANFNNCIIDLNLGSKISNDLTNGFKTDISNAQTNDQSSDQKAKTSSEIIKETVQESSIMKSIDNVVNNLGGLVGGLLSAPMYIIGGIILLIVGVPIILSFAGGSSRNRDDYGGDSDDGGDRGRGRGRGMGNSGDLDELEGGGVKGNIYLLATFVAMIILIARKSLPLCVVLLVIIILYFVHKKNPELLGLQDTK